MRFLRSLLQLLRPTQWTKNGLILAPAFFAFFDPSQSEHIRGVAPILKVIFAAGLFSIVSGGIYALNDVCDRERDILHPVKRFRPVASGAISVPAALSVSGVFLALGTILSFLLELKFGVVVAGYILLQIAYSLILKQIPLLDVFVIAAGFVMRVLAGALAVEVRVSAWLLLTTFLLALFLALCKRLQEKRSAITESRPSLAQYDENFLRELAAITAAATIVVYSMYTLCPDTIERFGTSSLGFTIPFVIFGIFRYLFIVHRYGAGERPEQVLLTDRVLIITIFLFLAACAAIFLWMK